MQQAVRLSVLFPLRGLKPSRMIRIVRSREGELSWDPEGLFGPPETGLIARREISKRMETDREFATKVAEARTEIEKEAMSRRAARVEPKDLEEFVEYFLNTDMDDMRYEVTRYRPKLTPEFFTYLDKVIGMERFSDDPNQERISELESLRAYLEEATQAIDKTIDASQASVEKLKKLLTAKDKKAMILEMVGNNEIDAMLIDFMDRNIQDAEDAGEKEKAAFMQKLRDSCKRYIT